MTTENHYTWGLMPWAAVHAALSNPCDLSLVSAYADAASRTYDKKAWSRVGFAILRSKAKNGPHLCDDLVWKVLAEVCSVLEYESIKGGPEGFAKVLAPSDAQMYREECRKHLIAEATTGGRDPQSNLPHWAHALCYCLFLIYVADQHEDEVTDGAGE